MLHSSHDYKLIIHRDKYKMIEAQRSEVYQSTTNCLDINIDMEFSILTQMKSEQEFDKTMRQKNAPGSCLGNPQFMMTELVILGRFLVKGYRDCSTTWGMRILWRLVFLRLVEIHWENVDIMSNIIKSSFKCKHLKLPFYI